MTGTSTHGLTTDNTGGITLTDSAAVSVGPEVRERIHADLALKFLKVLDLQYPGLIAKLERQGVIASKTVEAISEQQAELKEAEKVIADRKNHSRDIDTLTPLIDDKEKVVTDLQEKVGSRWHLVGCICTLRWLTPGREKKALTDETDALGKLAGKKIRLENELGEVPDLKAKRDTLQAELGEYVLCGDIYLKLEDRQTAADCIRSILVAGITEMGMAQLSKFDYLSPKSELTKPNKPLFIGTTNSPTDPKNILGDINLPEFDTDPPVEIPVFLKEPSAQFQWPSTTFINEQKIPPLQKEKKNEPLTPIAPRETESTGTGIDTNPDISRTVSRHIRSGDLVAAMELLDREDIGIDPDARLAVAEQVMRDIDLSPAKARIFFDEQAPNLSLDRSKLVLAYYDRLVSNPEIEAETRRSFLIDYGNLLKNDQLYDRVIREVMGLLGTAKGHDGTIYPQKAADFFGEIAPFFKDAGGMVSYIGEAIAKKLDSEELTQFIADNSSVFIDNGTHEHDWRGSVAIHGFYGQIVRRDFDEAISTLENHFGIMAKSDQKTFVIIVEETIDLLLEEPADTETARGLLDRVGGAIKDLETVRSLERQIKEKMDSD